jgi:mRNA interferase MazF
MMKRGSIYWCELDPTRGTEITKTRPVVIVSNDTANSLLSRVVVVPLTSNIKHVFASQTLVIVNGSESKAVADQMRTVDKSRIKGKIGELTPFDMEQVNEILREHLDL